jgi:hypothetical protein
MSPAKTNRNMRLPPSGSPAVQKSASPASANKKTAPKAACPTVGFCGYHSVSLFGCQFPLAAYVSATRTHPDMLAIRAPRHAEEGTSERSGAVRESVVNRPA